MTLRRTMPSAIAVRARAAAASCALAVAILVAGCDSLEQVPPASATATPVPPAASATRPPARTATPTSTPEPTPRPEDPGLVALGEQMQAAIDGYWSAGNFSAAVTDLQTGQTAGAYMDQRQLPGCVMNLYVIIVVLQEVDAGAYALEAVDSLIRATIWSSNAQTAFELYKVVGGGDPTVGVRKVAALHEQLGFELTAIDHPPAFGDDTIGVSADNWMTAGEINEALAALYHGELLSPALTTYLLDAMVEVKPGLNYLTAYGNGGVTSHKNGFFPYSGGYVDNDAGIVRFERGGREYAYAVSFFSDGVPSKYADIVLGQQLTALAWAYFDATYPAVVQ